METKICTKCKENKTLGNFYFRENLNKYKTRCRECIKKEKQLWEEKNKEKHKQQSKIWKQEHKEEIKQYNKEYKLKNKEKIDIDHIIPLSKAKTEEDIIKLCHYTNLQLLKHNDNLKKGNKLNWNLLKEK